MKYINSIYDLLLESVESYSWELASDNDKKVRYRFQDTIDNWYLVEFKNIPILKSNNLGTEYELSYFVYDPEKEYYEVSKIVNVNLYRTVETIFGGILKDFIKRKSWVKKITMVGLPKEQEKEYISQRTKVYLRYLQRNPIPGYKLEYFGGNRINLIKT